MKRNTNKEARYKLVWRGEIIEEDIQDFEEAKRLRTEYNIAFGGGVTLRKQRSKK